MYDEHSIKGDSMRNKVPVNSVVVNSGTSVFVLLTCVFAAAKLFKFEEEMSWWFVFSPLWAPFAFLALVCLLLAVAAISIACFDEAQKYLQRKQYARKNKQKDKK